ncbi:MAG TPA: metallophosphoesterase [Candidatus Acidoferrum sp.]|nr:metallophosphoesterase [Candidatus Acidoferrum sp.]
MLRALDVNWGWLFLRVCVGLAIISLLFLSQRFWFRALWRMTAGWGTKALRIAARLLYLSALILVILATYDGLRMGHGRIIPRGTMITALAGLWYFSALLSYVAVKFVHGFDRIWQFAKRLLKRNVPAVASSVSANPDVVANPSRRYFFQTATAAAGAAPFLSAVYGFAAERLNYQFRYVEIPLANLPRQLDGMKIAQISDIHLSGYMPRSQVRRAVDMANELDADLAVVTGDFITGAGDPIEDCIDEVRCLQAPLGVWGCNGNHEIYAGVEAEAKRLFARNGMRLLRSESAQLQFRGASFNLIGVDYQRERTPSGRRVQMLAGVGSLVRKDMPNILLSHNPNSFNRAAELGIELSLAGHTHGGQVQVEILDHRLSPARFITDYVAGLYTRPLFEPARSQASGHFISAAALRRPASALYVNRGLGTVGAPVRLGVPPEITLITLRSA